MEKPNIPEDNWILVERTRADEEVTRGIERNVDQLYVLNVRKRIEEFLLFGCLYGTGIFLMFLFKGIILFTVIGIILMGVALNSLGVFLHEGLHGLLAKDSRTNHLLSFLIGLPIMISATAYYTTHLNHHYELGRKLDYGTYRQYTKNPSLVWIAYFLQLFFGSILYVIFIPFLGFKSASSKSRIIIILEYIVIIGTFASFFTYVPISIILIYWMYPLLIMNILTNIRGLGSHALGDLENIYLSSRTIESSKFISFLFLYENYHLAHHLFPRTPSYNLFKMHSLIWHRLPQAIYSESYFQFLSDFLKVAFRKNLSPMGVVNPIQMKRLNEAR